MSNLRQAAQQALDALQMMRDTYNSEYACPACDHADAAITTLRAALAEPGRAERMRDAGYTRRPTLRELAEPEQCSCGDRSADQCPGEWEPECDLGNNAQYAKAVPITTKGQEPVAWQWLDTANFRKRLPADAITEHWRPLYSAPTPRKPVELTDEDIDRVTEQQWTGPNYISHRIYARAVIAAYEDKNRTGEQT